MRALLLILALAGCSGATVRTQTRVAASASAVANRALPLWLAEYEREGARAQDAACPDPHPAPRSVCETARLAATDRVDARWDRVAAGWEAVRETHGLWAARLNACNAGRGEGAQRCGVDLDVLAADFAGAVARWRCSVREIGAARLDEFPGEAVCPPATDGSARDQ